MTRDEQRQAALRQANAARLAAAQLRATIQAGGRRAGARRAADVVEARESSLRFFDLLRAVPGVGPAIAKTMLRKARINPAARVDSRLVAAPQRTRLVGELIAYANGGRARA